MLTWMLSYKHVHILHKVQISLIKKIHPYVFTFRCSHFTHTRILHMLPSLQHKTWYTFTDSQESSNNIHTHGFKFRYTLGHTQTCISTLKHCFSLLWHVQAHIFTLVISTTHTCRHWHIHSHKHTQISFTWKLSHIHSHAYMIKNSLTLMRLVYPQWHTHLNMQANTDIKKNMPRYSSAHKQ